MVKNLTVIAILCVRNGELYIAEALESVRQQTRPVDAVLVVDDGSSDDTCRVAKAAAPEAIILRTAPAGLANARNVGAAAAKGDLLAFLDADDLWPPHRTRALIDALSAQSSAGMVCGRTRIQAIRPGMILDERLRRADGTQIPFLIHSGFIRTAIWRALGGMDPARERSEDVDLYLRMLEARIPIAYSDDETLIYRFHGDNRSRELDLAHAALFGTFRAASQRRRRGSIGAAEEG